MMFVDTGADDLHNEIPRLGQNLRASYVIFLQLLKKVKIQHLPTCQNCLLK